MTPATSRGFSAVEFAEDVLGIRLIPWQRWLLIHALETLPDGRFRFRTLLILVARQNGKTSVVEIKNLWKMFVLGVRMVIGTAQNLDTSEESWDKAVEIVEGIPELAAEVVHVDRTNGKKALRIANGARWKIAAASRRGGRGLSGDDVNLDELREHQTWESWGAVTKTTMARARAQIWAFSNAGDDKSVVLNDLQAKGRAAARQLVALLARLVVAEAEEITRQAAAEGIDTRIGHFEWSAPEDVRCTCGRPDPDPTKTDAEPVPHAMTCRLRDRQAWAQANPSLGYTITEEAVESALNTDPEAIFRTEVLCQRVPSMAPKWRIIPEALWSDQRDPDPQRPADPAFAALVSHNRTRSVIAACGARPDGSLLVSIVDYRPGTHWLVERLADLKGRRDPVAVAVQDKGPTGSLLPAMAEAGLKPPDDKERPRRGDLAIPWADDVADAYGLFVDAVNQRRLFHADDAALNVAVADAGTRALSGGTAWDYHGEGSELVQAVTLAHWAYVTRLPLLAQTYDPLDNIW